MDVCVYACVCVHACVHACVQSDLSVLCEEQHTVVGLVGLVGPVGGAEQANVPMLVASSDDEVVGARHPFQVHGRTLNCLGAQTKTSPTDVSVPDLRKGMACRAAGATETASCSLKQRP